MNQCSFLPLIVASCLIWSNVQAEERAVRPAEPARAGLGAPGAARHPDAGAQDRKHGPGKVGDRLLVTGQRPGIRPENMRKSSQREARRSILKFKFKLPKLRLRDSGP